MKKGRKIVAALLMVLPLLSSAQQYEKYEGNNEGWSVNANIGTSLFYGDIKQFRVAPLTTSYTNEYQASGGIIVSKQLFSFLSLRGQLLTGKLSGIKRSVNEYFKTSYVDYSLNLKLDITKLIYKEVEKKTSFYTYAGIGMMDYRVNKYNISNNQVVSSFGYNNGSIYDANNNKIKATTETVFPLGIGVDYMLSYNVSMNLDYSRRIVNNDKVDATIGKAKHDMFDYISVGITYHFRGPKDSDKDGIPDNIDKCPNTPLGVAVTEFGCPKDVDGDSIADYLDKCPNVKGLAQFNGCPDTDGDGIQDSEDKCPNVKGLAQFGGCPDTDGDGIEDSKDSCVNEKGLAQFGGCPDADGDGIPDKRDRCPQIKGLAQFKGCPDTDGDGIPDIDDKCPQIVGLDINMGCPAVKKEVLRIFEKALTGIQFETGKDVIKKTSNSILDQVVKAMIENPTYNLEINGHTDNVGDAQKNLVLSQKRADAVKKYLTSKAVPENRIKSTGFGSTVPVADNATTEGKAKNRRVEFKVVFQTVEQE